MCCIYLLISVCLLRHVCYGLFVFVFFFFKQKTAYEMRISDWSSDVCSSDLHRLGGIGARQLGFRRRLAMGGVVHLVLDRLEELRARLRPRIIVHGSRVDIEHLLVEQLFRRADVAEDRKSTRLNSSH